MGVSCEKSSFGKIRIDQVTIPTLWFDQCNLKAHISMISRRPTCDCWVLETVEHCLCGRLTPVAQRADLFMSRTIDAMQWIYSPNALDI